MIDVVNTIEEYEAVIREYSSRIFLVGIPDDLAMEIIENYPDYREDLAPNKTLSESIIRVLSVDKEDIVRKRIAAKRATPPDVQIELAKDSSHSVRAAIGRNPKVPREALEILAQDEEDWIAERAQERLDALDSADAK